MICKMLQYGVILNKIGIDGVYLINPEGDSIRDFCEIIKIYGGPNGI